MVDDFFFLSYYLCIFKRKRQNGKETKNGWFSIFACSIDEWVVLVSLVFFFSNVVQCCCCVVGTILFNRNNIFIPFHSIECLFYTRIWWQLKLIVLCSSWLMEKPFDNRKGLLFPHFLKLFVAFLLIKKERERDIITSSPCRLIMLRFFFFFFFFFLKKKKRKGSALKEERSAPVPIALGSRVESWPLASHVHFKRTMALKNIYHR